MIEALFYNYMREMLRQTPMEFHCYLYDEINWDNRLIGILSTARGGSMQRSL